jgi:uncharacterized membrane protein YhaH (DUF805 family)
MTFVESIQTCFKKYADFSGRASRSEYWWWALFVLLITIVGQVIGDILGGIASLAMLLPYLAVTSRRLHDIGKSGWWQLIGFIPLIGWAVLIYWCVQGPKEPNTYG